MRWMFATSDHDIEIVLIVKFDGKQREISWRLALQPVLRQRITISRDDTTDPSSYNVTPADPLVLGLRLLFARDPSPQQGRDIVLGTSDLQAHARKIWRQAINLTHERPNVTFSPRLPVATTRSIVCDEEEMSPFRVAICCRPSEHSERGDIGGAEGKSRELQSYGH